MNNMIDDEKIEFRRIESLTDYVKEIIELRERLIADGRSESIFFRGQNCALWDLRPSIFRDSLVNIEDKIIQMAIARAPFEFNNHSNAFEKLTKLQHYGLPTRLLDVTMNPLVALYFACQPLTNLVQELSDDEEISLSENDGVVYYSCAYDETADSSKVQIASSLALKEINKDTTLKKLKEEIIGIPSDLDPKIFINIIQSNYFVKSDHNNDRLIRQSGAFLLSGSITISENVDDLWHSKVQKSICSLNSEFDSDKFIISGDAKERILEELDFCNINEATLFPELERQMSHIKRIGTKKITELVSNFVRFESKCDSPSFDIADLNDVSINKEIMKSVLANNLNDPMAEEKVFSIIEESSKYTDWHKKESVLSSLISNIKRELSESGFANPKEKATRIVYELINNI